MVWCGTGGGGGSWYVTDYFFLCFLMLSKEFCYTYLNVFLRTSIFFHFDFTRCPAYC